MNCVRGFPMVIYACTDPTSTIGLLRKKWPSSACGSDVKYTVLTESIRSSSWKYTVFSRNLYGLFTETIPSAKVYGPQNSKVCGLIKKCIRSFSGNYTVCESIRSWITDESYDVKTESIRSWSWLIINESYDVKIGRPVYFPRYTSYDALIMSQLEDRILSAICIIWLVHFESAWGPYTSRSLSHDSFIMSQVEDHILSAIYIIWLTYVLMMSLLEDRILSVEYRLRSTKSAYFWNGPYTFRKEPYRFHKRPYTFERRPYTKDRTVYV